MKRQLRRIALAFVAGMALFSASSAFADDAATMPVILELKTDIYNVIGPSNQFTIYLGSLSEQTEFYVETARSQEYVWVDPYYIGTDSDGDKAAIATAITCSVSETDNTIKIHGDASQINFLDIHGCYITNIDFKDKSKWSNLEVFDASHNYFAEIDLSNLDALYSVDLTDNQFVVGSKMKLGTYHPNLAMLQVGINDAVDPELELKNYPNLVYFSGRNNYGITHIDPTQNPYLVSLVLEVTNISSIDVSKNPYLNVLNISNTKITSIDLSHNLELEEFYASHEGSYNSDDRYKLTSIDVSHNTKLGWLDLSGNKLTSLDLTKNPNLQSIFLQRNLLSELDLSNCNKLAKVYLYNNLFTFATLPIPQYGWDYIYYRSPLPCNFKYKVGDTIDFSSSVIREPYTDSNGQLVTPVTDARVFTVGRLSYSDMIDPDSGFYTYADGKITFHQETTDSVYVRFSNSVFNDWDLDTQAFKVKTPETFDEPTVGFTFTPYSSMNGKEISFKLGLQPIATGVNYPATVTFNVDGEDVGTAEVNSGAMPGENNVSFTMPSTGGKVSVYVTDGFGVSNLAMDQIKIQTIDLSQAEDIANLSITNASLPSIDLSYNRGLVSLDLSNNLLNDLDLIPVRGDFEKWMLRNINLSNNHITSISVENSKHFTSLNLSHNWLTSFDLEYYGGLTSLDLSDNYLSGDLNVSALTNLRAINVRGNELTSVTGADWSKVREADLTDNYMGFSAIPAPAKLVAAESYAYLPQKNYRIIAGGASVNMSNQNVDGATVYKWFNADTKAEVTSGFTTENGVTRFDESLVGSTLYCEMSNPAYPASNETPLTTTNFVVREKPETLVASFTPAESGFISIGFAFATTGANAVYVDWSGDGSQYDEYIYDDVQTAIYRGGTAVAGKTAKVYTYGDAADVTKLFINNPGTETGSRIKLLDFDATPMTKAQAFDIHNAGLTDGSLRLPASKDLGELVFDGNAFENEVLKDADGNPFSPTGRSFLLNLANNKYKSFDIGDYPWAQYIYIDDNQIESVKMPETSNDRLVQISINNNKLKSFEFKNLNALSAILLNGNDLETIDVSPVKNTLRALAVSGNRFSFATLPRLEEFNIDIFTYYDYFAQKPIEVECVEGVVDMTNQYEVPTMVFTDEGYVPQTNYSTYRWFLGDNQNDVYYDYYYEEFVGEELEGPEVSEDPEYGTYGGKTYFYYTQKRKVIGAVTNESFPSLILYTTPFTIDAAAGVENVTVEEEDVPVNVYTIAGAVVRKNVLRSEAVKGLPAGLYIVGNRKVLVK